MLGLAPRMELAGVVPSTVGGYQTKIRGEGSQGPVRKTSGSFILLRDAELSSCCAVLEVHAVPKLAFASERSRRDKFLDKYTAIGLNYPL